MAPLSKCLQCGAELPASSRFCTQCGALQSVKCTACGHTNAPGSRFCAQCGAEVGDTAASLPAAPLPAHPSSPITLRPPSRAVPSAERRQLTLMFCDLVGSTALSARLDPEDMREVIALYQKCVADVMARFSGFVAKYMGDGVLVYFGYPEAHEDDAERAIRAGLALIAAASRLVTKTGSIQTRIGIATGLVIVGDLIGSGVAQEQGVVGETPNLAARLQALAEPNSIAIAPSTRRLTGDLFECESLGEVELKGFAAPVTAWRVVRESAIESRFEALRSEQTLLVGREEELDLLLRRWHQAQDGEGRAVLISGEPGLGKSRILAALQEKLEAEQHARIRFFCSYHHQDSALHPILAWLQSAAGFGRDDSVDTKRAKLEALLARSAPDIRDTVVLLADLLGLPVANALASSSNEDPQRRRQRVLDALLQQIEGLAQSRPVLLIFEDVHWSDPTTLEFLTMMMERIPTLPILAIITFRPEYQPPWIGQPQVTMMALNRLGRRERMVLISHITGGKALPAELLEQIVTRTDGVPLFVEELTKAVMENVHLRETGDGYVLDQPLQPMAIPTSLQDSLMARIDRLGSARDILQMGAAIGREFSYELLAAIVGLPDPTLQDALSQLAAAELLFRRGTPPNATFTFKHALVQDAAYATMLRGPRQQLHARIGETLEKRFPEVLGSTPEVVAQHFEQAGQYPHAIRYWRQAGDRALHNSALKEAITHYSNALRLAAELSDPSVRAGEELAISLQLGLATQMAAGPSSTESAGYYERAEALSRSLPGRDRERFMAAWGLWLHCLMTHRAAETFQRTGEMLAIARELDDPDLMLEAYHAIAPGFQQTGDYQGMRDATEEVIRRYDRQRHRDHAYIFGGHDSRVCAHTFRAVSLWGLGFFDQSTEAAYTAIADARALGHAFSLAHGLNQSGLALMLLRNTAACQTIADELVPFADRNKFPWPLAYGHFLQGWLLTQRGEYDLGIKQMRTAAEQPSARNRRPLLTSMIAEALGRAGQYQAALEALDQARQLEIAQTFRLYTSETTRLRGEFLLRLSPANDAEAAACFTESIAIAEQQSCRAVVLRATASLARLRRDQNRRKEARDLLASVYQTFTEGFATPDLKEATALLTELS